jgi:hypothetical protein
MSRYFYEQRRKREQEERRRREAQNAGSTGSDLLNPPNPVSPLWVGVDYSSGSDSSCSYDSGSSSSDSGSCSSD